MHRLGGYGIPAIPTQPPKYLPTESGTQKRQVGNILPQIAQKFLTQDILPQIAQIFTD